MAHAIILGGTKGEAGGAVTLTSDGMTKRKRGDSGGLSSAIFPAISERTIILGASLALAAVFWPLSPDPAILPTQTTFVKAQGVKLTIPHAVKLK